MSAADLGSLALGWIADYGAPMLAFLLMLGGLGLPLPGTLLVIASGAFVRQNLLDLYTAPAMGLAGTVLGDVALYAIGYFAGHRLEKRYGQTSAWKNASELFARRGGIAIFLSRWLLTAIAFPVTLIAGSSNYRFRKFFLLDFIGELTWIVLYGGLGYVFGGQWELISAFISDFSGFLLGALVMGTGVYLSLRFRKKPALESGPVSAIGVGP